MRVLITLAGIHRVSRGAEVALEATGRHLATMGHEVTLIGTGPSRPSEPYSYVRTGVIPRTRFERWPTIGPLRDATVYESLSYGPGLARRYHPADFDITLTCGFPVDNIVLRRPTRGSRPRHIFVTENGDWPAFVEGGEARMFSCDALVCTNPVYHERNRDRWNSHLVPNGVDIDRFAPGIGARERLGLPLDTKIVLTVSALAENKRVDRSIDAVARLDDAVLVVAGDGPLRAELARHGAEQLGPRYIQATFDYADMPDLYRSADALLHPTLFESFGNIYIEAMATGLPVIAHRSEVTEWILGDAEQLIDTDDIDAVALALRTTLANGRAAGADERIDTCCERFAWHAVAERYETIGLELLPDHSP